MNDGSVPLCKYMTTCFPNIRPSQLAMFSTRSFARRDTTHHWSDDAQPRTDTNDTCMLCRGQHAGITLDR
jgi:hypothetical protein